MALRLMFWKNKIDDQVLKNIADLRQTIISLQSEVTNLKTELAALTTNQNSLRGLVNRKLSGEDKDIKSEKQSFPGGIIPWAS